MSQKITSKNLSYSSDLPPFLRALHAQAGSSDEPSTTGQRRSAKKRSGSEEAEDAPLVVDEDGNVVDVEVDKEGVVKSSGDGDATGDAAAAATGEDSAGKNEAAGSGKPVIGAGKRKVGRVIGEAAEEDAGKTNEGSMRSGGAKGDDVATDGLKEKKAKKKAKKIKLSFDDEEG
jgi:hypothetical protein